MKSVNHTKYAQLIRSALKLCLIFIVVLAFFGFLFSGSTVASAADNVVSMSIFADNSVSTESYTWFLGSHAWLYFENISDKTIKIGAYTLQPKGEAQSSLSLGTYGNQDDGLGIYYNLEAYIFTQWPNNVFTNRISLTVNLDESDISFLNSMLGSLNTWSITNTCASFASNIWDILVGPTNHKWLTPTVLPSQLMVEMYTKLSFDVPRKTMRSTMFEDVYRYMSQTEMTHISDFSYGSPIPTSPSPNETLQSKTVTFKWGPVPGVTKYKLELISDQGKKLSPSVTSSEITYALPDSGRWSWKVASYTDDRIGDWSSTTWFTVNEINPTNNAPDLVQPLSGTYQVGDKPYFQWSDVNANFYKLNLYNENTGESHIEYIAATSYNNYALPSAGTWRWSVSSCATFNYILATSSERTFTVTAAPTPISGTYDIPTLLSPGDGSSFNAGDTINFQWSDTGASLYRLVVICDSGTGYGTFDEDVGGTSYSYKADIEGDWRWQVQSYNGSTPGDAPHTKSFTVNPTSSGGTTVPQVHADFYIGIEVSGDVIYSMDMDKLDADWGTGSPNAVAVPGDVWSARFTAPFDTTEGWYRFHYEVDDGIKIWVYDNCITDRWGAHVLNEYSPSVFFLDGTHDVKIEYVEFYGEAKIKVNLETASAPSISLFTPTNNAVFTTDDIVTFTWSGLNLPAGSRYILQIINAETGAVVREGIIFWHRDRLVNWSLPVGDYRWQVFMRAGPGTTKEYCNSDFGTFTITDPVPTQPDLKPSDIEIEKQGDTYLFRSDIQSLNQVPAGSFKVRWLVNGTVQSESTISWLSGNSMLSDDSFSLIWTPPSSGTYTVVFEVDSEQQITETDEINNSTSTTITATITKPDLSPTQIIYDPDSLYVGADILFDTGICNNSSEATDVFNISWYVNGVRQGYGSHEGIPANQTILDGNSAFIWNPTKSGTYTILFDVDSDQFIDETDENNNSTSVQVYISPSPSITPTPTPTPTPIPSSTMIGKPGDTIDIEIPLNNADPITALQVSYTLSSGLTFVNANCSNMSGPSSSQTAVFINQNGVTNGMVTLKVRINDETTTDQAVNVTKVTGANESVRITVGTIRNYAINVELSTPNPGDANDDGAVDIMDLVNIIDYIVSGTEPGSMTGADANGDGSVDIMDLVFIIDLIVNPPVNSAPAASTVRIEVPFHSSTPITALELAYSLSPGLTFVNAECSGMVGAGGETNAVFANVNGGVTSGMVTLEVALQNGVTADQSINVTAVTGANTGGKRAVGSPQTYIIDVNASALSILTQPVDTTVSVGNTATFTVEAAGPEPLTYQWYINTNTGVGWQAVAGAIENTYTTDVVTLTDNSFRYFCHVTAGEPYLDSEIATLTVVASPQTGDNSNVFGLIALALITGIGMVYLFQYSRYKAGRK